MQQVVRVQYIGRPLVQSPGGLGVVIDGRIRSQWSRP